MCVFLPILHHHYADAAAVGFSGRRITPPVDTPETPNSITVPRMLLQGGDGVPSYRVRAVDFGDDLVVPAAHLRPMLEQFASRPVFIVRAACSGVRDKRHRRRNGRGGGSPGRRAILECHILTLALWELHGKNEAEVGARWCPPPPLPWSKPFRRQL